jgi:hypothetical protein
MGELYDLLQSIRNQAEDKIRNELSGFAGQLKAVIYNRFMPLVVNIQTENERCYFTFQKGGSVLLYQGLHNNPDVTVSGEHAELMYLLQTREKKRFIADEEAGKITITPRTPNGSKAVGYIREKLFLGS